MTNHPGSPLARAADVVLTTAARETELRSGATASRIAALTVVDCLYILVAQRNLRSARAEPSRRRSRRSPAGTSAMIYICCRLDVNRLRCSCAQRRHGDLPDRGRNPATVGLDTMSTLALLEALNAQDAMVAPRSRRPSPSSPCSSTPRSRDPRGRRVHYVGAGTSGRLGVLERRRAAPHLQRPRRHGRRPSRRRPVALLRAVENVEDDVEQGAADLAGATGLDVVIGSPPPGAPPTSPARCAGPVMVGAVTRPGDLEPPGRSPPSSTTSSPPTPGPRPSPGTTRLKAGTALSSCSTPSPRPSWSGSAGPGPTHGRRRRDEREAARAPRRHPRRGVDRRLARAGRASVSPRPTASSSRPCSPCSRTSTCRPPATPSTRPRACSPTPCAGSTLGDRPRSGPTTTSGTAATGTTDSITRNGDTP